MAINKFMRKALKALSYSDNTLAQNYKVDRLINDITHPSVKFLYKMSDDKITFDGHNIDVRIFEPKVKISEEILLYFHGGGWVSGSIDSYSMACARLSDSTGRFVMAVDYRLAPEFPFPCAVEDCYTVAKALIQKHGFENIILAGDSAGGNLAAAVSLMASDRNEFNVKKQILLYPATYNDHSSHSPYPSIRENGTDYLLTSKKICDYMDLYIRDKQFLTSPYFAPLLHENPQNQPRTLIITAEFDPLRDEGEAFGHKLSNFGNDVTIYQMKDALHGFFTLPVKYIHVKKSLVIINSFLNGGTVTNEGMEKTR